jgi:choline monooxygenase
MIPRRAISSSSSFFYFHWSTSRKQAYHHGGGNIWVRWGFQSSPLSTSTTVTESSSSSTIATSSSSTSTSLASYLVSNQYSSLVSLHHELCRYDSSLPINRAHTPPSSWYTWPEVYAWEKQHVFQENWVAVDIIRDTEPGSYQTGVFQDQPYLITHNSKGDIQAFYNVCTHAGSCLVGPWTDTSSQLCSNHKIMDGPSNQIYSGRLEGSEQQRRGLQCPYHGWQFNLDGRLIKTTKMKGIQDFTNKQYDLRPIESMVMGPILYLKFQSNKNRNDTCEDQNVTTKFRHNMSILQEQITTNGFMGDFSDLTFVKSTVYPVACNWKVFIDNYGDGCYHCSYAHKDLSSNIDESLYMTDLVTPDLSIQYAPPQVAAATTRFGTQRSAVYAHLYPNIMYNRYGPWLDVDIVHPISESSSLIVKAWYIEKSMLKEEEEQKQDKGTVHHQGESNVAKFIEESLSSSRQVHDEDVFLCENVQRGMKSNGFDRGRYVPQKQIASYHFHQRLASDLQKSSALDQA